MHGNILDANSTNKLINQSVKDAIDNSITNGNYVTRDLLEAETSARTKSDEDLNTKIKEEQTRAEGKEKQISDKLAIVDGDSNTEGSFRKAIADVIADKLAGNDDLYTALNQAIGTKADASALANEVSRATDAENDLRTAISAKQDAGDYALKTDIPQNVSQLTNDSNFITQQDADAKYALVNSLNTVNDSISSLRVGVSKKQDKITVNGVDVTDIETADITKLRTIVIDLIDALRASGLIRTNSNLE